MYSIHFVGLPIDYALLAVFGQQYDRQIIFVMYYTFSRVRRILCSFFRRFDPWLLVYSHEHNGAKIRPFNFVLCNACTACRTKK